MPAYADDAEMLALMRGELFTAVVGDVMDAIGLRRQFLPPELALLDPATTIAGRAMPVLVADVFADQPGEGGGAAMGKPFGLMLEALDSLREHEVYVSAGGSPHYALWGGLMSTRAMKLKAAGAVLDGYTRDTREILSLGFPVIARGRYGQDQGPRGKVIDFRVAVEIGQARIAPGDLVFGDVDGVLVVPRDAEAEVIARALEKVRGENAVRAALEDGMSAAAAFAKYGVM